MEVVGAIVGLLIIVGALAAAIRLLRRPTHRYRGDTRPQHPTSMRETMVTWLMGPRN